MPRKYLAFDLETAKDVPGEDFNWRPHRPLGISCAAAFPADAKEPIVWHGKKANGNPTERMSKAEAGKLVRELLKYVANGYTVLTWNGLGFDFDILAEESASPKECKELALNHVDMMFHVFCDRGFPVKLDKAAQALAIPESHLECRVCWLRSFGRRGGIKRYSIMWPRMSGLHSKSPLSARNGGALNG